MKRIISIAFAAIMLICCITGCGAKRDPKYVGKWEAVSMEMGEESIDNFMGVPIAALFRFEIAENGKVTWRSAIDNNIIQNANDDMDIIWKETADNTIEFKVTDLTGKNPTETMELTYRGDMLVIGEDGSSILLNKVDEFTEIDADLLNSAASAIQNFGIS